MMKKPFLILVLMFVANCLCNAQYFQNINLNNGLSQPSVMSICQDALGRMWFGTREGLNIYDGNKIKSFKGNVDNGKDGNIWIGNMIFSIVNGRNKDVNKVFFISDYFLYSYDIRTEIFSKIDTGGNVTAIAYSDDKLMFAQNNNIFSYSPGSDKKSIYKILPKGTHVNSLLIKDGLMYVGTMDGLVISPLDAIWDDKNILDGEDIYSIFRDSKKNLWIGTRMNGLYRMKNNEITKIPVSPDGIINRQIREFTEDDNGNVWFGTFMGLQMYDAKKDKYTAIKIPQYVGGLNHPSIFSLYKDKQGIIWAGTYYGGINYFNPTKRGIVHYDYQVKEEAEIFYSYIAEMAIDKRNKLWVSTDGGGISCLNSNWETVKQFIASNNKKPDGLPHNNIKSLCYDAGNDMLYIGTYLGGLSRYDIKNNKFHNYLAGHKPSKEAPGDVIHHIEKWNDKIIISSRKGMFSLDTRTDEFTKLPGHLGSGFIFNIDNRGSIYSVKNNDIIVSKLDDLSESEVIKLDIDGEVSNILATGEYVYICTLGSGLIIYDTAKKSQTVYTSSNSNLPSNYCYSSKLTPSKKLILTGDKGITMFDLENKTFSSIKQSHLKAPIIYGCGICVSDDNNIYIGDTKGITQIRESDFASISNHYQPVYLSDIYINNNKIVPSSHNDILKTSLAFADEICLDHNGNNITVEFASSDYTDGNVQQIFEYKLEGQDKDWNTTTVPAARYTNLSPGKYRLLVKMQGVNNGNCAELKVIISKPWYNTLWAWIIYIIVIITIIEVIIRYRNEKRNLALSLEKEKFEKQNIEKLNHEKLVFFTNVSHEFRTPLTLIISHIESLMQMPSLEPAVYNRIMKLKQNAQYMNNLVSELLDFRKFTQNRYTLKIAKGNISNFMSEIFYTFSDYANRKNLEYKITSEPENIVCWFDGKQLEKVFFNLLSNAFKYTPDGGIYIRIYTENNMVYISIHDTGRGISKNDSMRIFDRFYQTDDKKNTSTQSGTGIGLALTKSIVEKHHGNITLESNLGKGSTFTVCLPIDLGEYINDEHVKIIEESKDNERYSLQSTETHDEEKYNLGIPDPEDNGLLKGSNDHKKYNLLVVEDNPELIQVLDELFSPFYNTIKATNGKEGLEKAYEYKPDLIISDIMMPEMTGTEMCLQIKNSIDLCHIPVILLTALNSTEQNIEGLNRGADDYISKPFNAKLLLARANNLVRNRLLIHHQISKNPISEVDLTSINPIDQDILRKTSEAIEAHIDDPEFDIPELCKEIGVGRSVLYSKFKSLTGMTPNSYILNYRLKYAAAMLQKYPDMPVAEVGDKCGFGSPVYFGRCFKNQFGITPQNYRKANKA